MEIEKILETYREKIKPVVYATLGNCDVLKIGLDEPALNLYVELNGTYGNLRNKIDGLLKEGKFKLNYAPKENHEIIEVSTTLRYFESLVEKSWVKSVDGVPRISKMTEAAVSPSA